jgi:outer membrane protein assembly factor BamB
MLTIGERVLLALVKSLVGYKKEGKKMNFTRNLSKKTLSIITILLSLSMIIPIAALSTTSAHTPIWNIPTYAYIETPMNPVGVGQTAVAYMWLDKTISGALMTNNIRFQNYKLTVTAPNGDVTTKTWDVVQDTTSSQSYSFAPDQVGTYTLNFTFPGQTYTLTGAYQGDYYLPSNASTTLTVTQEPIQSASGGTAMPTEYWSRPIFGENSAWYTVSSNWLGCPGAAATNQGYGSCYPGDAVGSQTSHIMWTKPIQDGGIVGGNLSTIAGASFFEGTAYNGRYKNPIIVAGKLYYTDPISFTGAVSGATVCVDLRTGQEIWRRTDIPALSHALVYDVQTPNQHGTYNPILVAAIGASMFGLTSPYTWMAFDSYTGNFLFNATNVPGGTTEVGPNGEFLVNVLKNYGNATNPNWYLQRWNSTNLWTWGNSPAIGTTVDASTANRYDYNVSVSFDGISGTSNSILWASNNEFAICRSGAYPSLGGTSFSWTYYSVNLNADSSTLGRVLWTNTVNAPSGNQSISYSGSDKSAGVFVEKYKETMSYTGYSMATGKQLWTTDGNQDALNYYASGYNAGGNQAGAAYAYGKLYVSGMSGILYCYDLSDGKLQWTFGNGGEGNNTYSGEVVPGHYPITTYAIGNGIIYTTVTEHTVNTPIYKGAMNLAINATDGTQVWAVRAVTEEAQSPPTGAMADGFNTFLNGYDNRIYVIGRGSSQTTVMAPTLSTTYGDSVLIQGTVTDTSSGTTQDEQAARFPDGVPVSSDASMTEWMAYVYQQAACPNNFTGVEVTVNVIDSNGNYRPIGTAMTDATGHYSLVWKPDIEGKYTVYASFAGTEGYWSSTATTAFNVDPAPATATPQPTQAPSAADLYFLPAIAGLFLAVIVSIVLTLLVLRKRP